MMPNARRVPQVLENLTIEEQETIIRLQQEAAQRLRETLANDYRPAVAEEPMDDPYAEPPLDNLEEILEDLYAEPLEGCNCVDCLSHLELIERVCSEELTVQWSGSWSDEDQLDDEDRRGPGIKPRPLP